MARIDSVYNYYIATYANKEVSRYDSHKKSDLRKVYNQIIKSNKESPLYKIPDAENVKRYAIDIKENARSLKNVVASLADQYGVFEDSFQKKVAVSSDESKVGVSYIGDGNEDTKSENFNVSVQRLATPQINLGNYLKDDVLTLRPGSYSFDLSTLSAAYEFQYNVNSDETNLDILQKLARLVNSSDLGITAAVHSDKEGASALSLTSVQTGLSDKEDYLFSISPDASAGSVEAMDILGINQVAEPAHNSVFTLNGHSHSSLSNTFSINNVFELTLKDVTESEDTVIGFKPNTDAIADNIRTLTDTYNNALSTAKSYTGSSASDGNRLQRDMAALSLHNYVALNSIGLMVDPEDGSISIDKDVLSEAVTEERAEQTFETLTQFRDSIGKKADAISINPMYYVNKIIVTYKNPGHNFATPYISSIYSGMILDDYV